MAAGTACSLIFRYGFGGFMSPKFWEYYLNIEADLTACSRYVEFVQENYNTYSNEFARIIVIACAEIDAIFRELCNLIDSSAKADKIYKYFPIILSVFPNFRSGKLDIRRCGLVFEPWKSWEETISPEWWGKSYNKIKHDRYNHFEKASLENALNSVGALLITILYYHQYISGKSLNVDLNRGTQLFAPAKAPTDKSGAYWFYSME